MLVLGRRPGEYVVINDTITVQVVKTEEGQLRLAIDAPKHIKIVRGELLDDQSPAKEAKALYKEPVNVGGSPVR